MYDLRRAPAQQPGEVVVNKAPEWSELHQIPTADLRTELERREKEASKAPLPLAHPDFSALVKTITDGVARAVDEEYEDEDFKRYVYEAALTAVYGGTYWKWRNERKW
jgi:hypothetical protein